MRLPAIMAMAFLAGCVAPGGAPPDAPGNGASARPGSDACGAEGLQHLVGQPLPGELAVSGPVRVFAEGDPVTMDFSPARLNIELDPDRQTVNRIFCG